MAAAWGCAVFWLVSRRRDWSLERCSPPSPPCGWCWLAATRTSPRWPCSGGRSTRIGMSVTPRTSRRCSSRGARRGCGDWWLSVSRWSRGLCAGAVGDRSPGVRDDFAPGAPRGRSARGGDAGVLCGAAPRRYRSGAGGPGLFRSRCFWPTHGRRRCWRRHRVTVEAARAVTADAFGPGAGRGRGRPADLHGVIRRHPGTTRPGRLAPDRVRPGVTTSGAAGEKRVVSTLVESPTFGGSSWFAHIASVRRRGARPDTNAVDDQQRETVVGEFARHGYRTLAHDAGLWPPGPKGRSTASRTSTARAAGLQGAAVWLVGHSGSVLAGADGRARGPPAQPRAAGIRCSSDGQHARTLHTHTTLPARLAGG